MRGQRAGRARHGQGFQCDGLYLPNENRFPRDYRDKYELEHGGNIGFAQVWRLIANSGKASEGQEG
jgi:hypothetical protein